MKFGVITFPGSNCDQDMIYVLESTMGYEVERLWHKDADLKGVDFVILPAGSHLEIIYVQEQLPIILQLWVKCKNMLPKVVMYWVFVTVFKFCASQNYCQERCCTIIIRSLPVRMFT